MTKRFVVTGTDTNIGKTVFSAALVNALGGCYWKPVQAGLDGETDSQVVRRLGCVSDERIIPEAWRLWTAASPHLAAKIDGVSIVPEALSLPKTSCPVVVEGAGGVLVPLTGSQVLADVFSRWKVPVILCARTALGTINHTLLSLEALRSRNIPILGVAFIGAEENETQTIIVRLGNVACLGRMPSIDPLTPESLQRAFREHFDLALFQQSAS